MKVSAHSADTSREPAGVFSKAAHERMLYYRQMSSEQRLLLTLQLSDAKRAEVAAKIREKHPEYSAGQARFAEIRLRLGVELFSAAYPDVQLPQCGECCDSLRSMWDS